MCNSAFTGKALSHTTLSSALARHKRTGHDICFDDFSFLCSASSQLDVFLRESLLISKLNPSLNANIRSFPFTLNYFVPLRFITSD